MHPRQTTELLVTFASQASPWWLAVLIPLAVAACWLLYRKQLRGLSAASASGLCALRMALVACILVLAFKPSLLRRKTLTYPGQIILLLDDSESMAAHDNALADAEALRVWRQTHDPSDDAGSVYHALEQALASVTTRLRRFQSDVRGIDRASDAYWDRAEAAERAMTKLLDRIQERLPVPPAGGVGSERLPGVRDEIRALRAKLASFCRDTDARDEQAFDRYGARVAGVRKALRALQAATDKAAVAAGDEELLAKARAVRERPRLELLADKLGRALPAVRALAPGQFVRIARMMSDELVFDPGTIEAARGKTDIVGRLRTLVEEEADHPISAIVLLSDGIDHGGKPASPLYRELARRQIPVHTAGVGGPKAPFDIAVLGVTAPPFAVKGAPVKLKVRLKAVLPAEQPVRLDVLDGEHCVAPKGLTLGARGEPMVALAFTPSESGFFRYTVRVDSAAHEVFPVRNNRADVAIHVRDESVKVLLLDWKPRWETRFVLNILQRMDYIELNAIVVLAREEAALARGRRGGSPCPPSGGAACGALGRMGSGSRLPGEARGPAPTARRPATRWWVWMNG